MISLKYSNIWHMRYSSWHGCKLGGARAGTVGFEIHWGHIILALLWWKLQDPPWLNTVFYLIRYYHHLCILIWHGTDKLAGKWYIYVTPRPVVYLVAACWLYGPWLSMVFLSWKEDLLSPCCWCVLACFLWAVFTWHPVARTERIETLPIQVGWWYISSPR